MSERESNPIAVDERDEVARLKTQLANAEAAANKAEAFGKFDVTAPNVGDDTYESYLAQRPEDGIIRDGESFRDNKSGQFASAEAYGSNKTPQSTADYYHNLMESDSKPYEEKDFKSLGLKQLVFEMAKAENLGDKALSLEVQDAMGSRLTELAEKEGWTLKQKDEQADILLAQVLKLSGQGEHKTELAKDAKVESNTIPTPGDAVFGIPPLESEANIEPALDGESIEKYGTRNKRANIDTLGDVVVSPVPGEQTLPDVLDVSGLDPLSSEKMPVDDLSDAKLENIPEPDNAAKEKLDEEKQSIWNKVMDRTKDLYAKVGALYSTNMTLYAVGNFLPTPKQKFEKNESIDQFEARVRRYGTYKIIGAVALIVASAAAAKHGLSLLDGGGADASGGNISPKVSTGPGYGVHEVLTTVAPGSEFTPSAHTVTRGEGWYQTFKEMGITDKTEQANVLEKVKSQLLESGWGYTMPNGSTGISHTGQLPENVLKLIKNSR